MVLTLTEYGQIRTMLINSNNRFNLEQLKTALKEQINSQRIFERIHSLAYLFKILEKRDALGPGHMSTLDQIIEKVDPDNMEIKRLLHRREPNFGDVPKAVGNNNNPFNNNNQPMEHRVLPPISTDVVEQIHSRIKSCIGRKWEELARNLGVQEGEIDNLQFRYRSISRMIGEVLTLHKDKCGRNFERWRSELQQALVKARRRDLSEEIDDILTFNHMNG